MTQIQRLKDPEISNGNLIVAEDLDAEFNQLVSESNAQDIRLVALESQNMNIKGVKTFVSNPKMDGILEKTIDSGLNLDNLIVKDGYIITIPETQPFLPSIVGQFGYDSINDQYLGFRGGSVKKFMMDGDTPPQTDLTPTGTIHLFAGSIAPAGYLLCFGQAVLISDYPGLYSVIQTTYGVGDGITTYNLPDLRGRVVLGLDNMGGTAAGVITSLSLNGANAITLGGKGGAETHTLTTAQLAAHQHTLTGLVRATSGPTGSGTSFSGPISGTTDNAGGGQPHNNTQPWIALNYIIKT